MEERISEDLYYKVVNYSEKSVALLVEREGSITEELETIGGKFNYRLSCGPGWIFSRKKSYDRLMHLMECYGIAFKVYELDELPRVDAGNPASKEVPGYIITGRDELARYAEEINYYDLAEFPKLHPIVVKLADGSFIPIRIEKLKTEFSFPDEGCDEEIERAKTEEYLITENCHSHNIYLSALDGTTVSSFKYAWLANWTDDGVNLWTVTRNRVNHPSLLDANEKAMYDKGLYRELSDDDRQRLITGYRMAIGMIEKRCRAWLKRYGVEKIRINTYWADR